MNFTASKTTPQLTLKVVAHEYQQITKLNDSLEKISSSTRRAPFGKVVNSPMTQTSHLGGNSCHLRTIQRKRNLWARKRSPHVFSKSQESFGYETYMGSFERTSGTQTIVKNTTWPVSYSSIRNSLNHRIPGLARSWTSHITYRVPGGSKNSVGS